MRLLLLLLPLMAMPAAAPAAETAKCSILEVAASQQAAEMARFTVSLTPAPDGVTYEWAVSVGEIVSGQNTASIDVRAPKGSFISATVIATGQPAGCNDTGNASREID